MLAFSNSCKYPTTNFVSYNHSSSDYQSFVGKVSVVHEPKSFEEAKNDHNWIGAIREEIFALEANKTYFDTLPEGCSFT